LRENVVRFAKDVSSSEKRSRLRGEPSDYRLNRVDLGESAVLFVKKVSSTRPEVVYE